MSAAERVAELALAGLGLTAAEIAERVGCSTRYAAAVIRRLRETGEIPEDEVGLRAGPSGTSLDY